jgi:hypothetical protein
VLAVYPLLCRQQNLRLCGESSASPTIKKTIIFVQIIIIVGVADSGGSGSKFIVASLKRRLKKEIVIFDYFF